MPCSCSCKAVYTATCMHRTSAFLSIAPRTVPFMPSIGRMPCDRTSTSNVPSRRANHPNFLLRHPDLLPIQPLSSPLPPVPMPVSVPMPCAVISTHRPASKRRHPGASETRRVARKVLARPDKHPYEDSKYEGEGVEYVEVPLRCAEGAVVALGEFDYSEYASDLVQSAVWSTRNLNGTDR